jgi:hypothetical protein
MFLLDSKTNRKGLLYVNKNFVEKINSALINNLQLFTLYVAKESQTQRLNRWFILFNNFKIFLIFHIKTIIKSFLCIY